MTDYYKKQAYNAVETDFTKVKSNSSGATAGIPFWGDDARAWDTIVIHGTELPGTCEVTGEGWELKVQKKKLPGKNGTKYTFIGWENAKITVELMMWTAEHLRAFEQLVTIMKPKAKTSKQVKRYRPGTKTLETVTVTEGGHQPHAIYHPALAIYGINTWIILTASIPKKKDDGVYTVTLHGEEYVPSTSDSGAPREMLNTDITTLASNGGEVAAEDARRKAALKPSNDPNSTQPEKLFSEERLFSGP